MKTRVRLWLPDKRAPVISAPIKDYRGFADPFQLTIVGPHSQ